MNILFLENEGSWRGQCSLKLNSGNNHKIDVLSDIQLSEPTEILARNIAEEFPFVDLFFINTNLLAGGLSRSECAGINLLKLIRFCHFDKHCVLNSFLSREQLLQLSPENLIIFSEGVTFVQLPYDFSKFDLENLAKRKAPADLSRYLKAESRIPDDRHFFANWWGALQLWKIHQILHSIDEDTLQSIQHQLFNSAKGIGTYQGLLAQYLYGQEIQKLSSAYIENKKELHNHFQRFTLSSETYNKRLYELDEKIETASKEQNRLSDILQEIKATDNWQQFFLKLSGKPKEIEYRIRNFEIGLKGANDEKQGITRFKELKYYIEEEENKIGREKKELISERAKAIEEKQNAGLNFNDGSTFIKILKEKTPKILYIDDKADEGWSSIFQLMIYGLEKPEKFRIIKPEKTSEINHIISSCFGLIDDFEPDLIILDLRLLGETGTISNAGELSGVKVLKALKNGFKKNSTLTYSPVSCPVMIVTASNKAFTYQSINTAGADAFWIKEGLDNKFPLDESIHNYWDFIWKVFILCCSDEFLFLEKIKNGLERLKATNTAFWWESDKRFSRLLAPDATLNKINKTIVFSILNECIGLTENLLQGMVLKNHSFAFENSLPSLIAIRLFQIVEIIHEENVNEYAEISIKKRVIDHHKNESYGRLNELLKLRNNAAHQISLTLKDLDLLFTYLIEYLELRANSNTIKPIQEYSSSGTAVSQKANQTNKRYTSFIIKKKYDCILISKNADDLQKDFTMNRNLQCFDKKIMKDERFVAGVSVQFEVKQISEDNFMALNVSLL